MDKYFSRSRDVLPANRKRTHPETIPRKPRLLQNARGKRRNAKTRPRALIG